MGKKMFKVFSMLADIVVFKASNRSDCEKYIRENTSNHDSLYIVQ